MEHQTVLVDEPEYENILDETEHHIPEPADLADQLYEEWRDERRHREGLGK